MALEDTLGGPDFTADSVLDRVSRGVLPDIPDNATADMVLNRLNRKLSTPRAAEPIVTPEPPVAKAPKSLDLSGQGVPVGDVPDLSSMGTPIDEVVPMPVPRPAEAPVPVGGGLSDYPIEFGKGVLEGGKNMGASALKGAAAVDIPAPADMGLLDTLAAAPTLDAKGKAKLMGDVMRSGIPRSLQMDYNAALRRIAGGADPAAEVAALRPKFEANNVAASTPVTESPTYKAGQAVEEFGKETLAPRPGFEPGKSWTRDLGAGAGSMAAGIGLSMIPYVGPIAAGTVFTGAGMGEATENAVKGGADPQQTRQAALLGGVAGATDMMDTLLPMLGSTGKAMGFMKRVGLGAIKGAMMEGGQEGVQQLAQNMIAQGIYKPDQDIWEDVPRSVAIAAILGGVGGGASGIAHRGETDPQPAQPGLPPPAGGAQQSGAAPPPGDGPSSPEDIAEFVRKARESAPPQPEAAPRAADPADMSEAEWINAYAASRASHDNASDAEILKASGIPDAAIAGLTEIDRINAVIRAAKSNASSNAQAKPEAKAEQESAPEENRDSDYSILRAYGYADEDINNMSERQRRREALDAVAEGIKPDEAAAKFKRPEAGAGQTANDSSTQETPSTVGSSDPDNIGTRAAPIRAQTAEDIAAAVPTEPTEAQSKAENYKHAHVEIEALGLTGRRSISVETGLGQERKGVDADGKPWAVKMQDAAYGRIKTTKGADGEALDIFVGPEPTSPHVFVVDQHNPGGKGFDEHKIMAGFPTPQAALAAYGRAYADGGGDRIGHVTAMTPDEFKTWLDGDTTKPLKPAAAPADTGKNVPESRATLKVQQNQLIAGERDVQMFPEGTRELPLPPGMERFQNERGMFHFNPANISAEDIEVASKTGRENELLGLGSVPKDEVMKREAAGEKPVTVVERTADGTEVRAAAGTESTAEGQRAELEAGKGAGNTVAIEDTADTVAKRKEELRLVEAPEGGVYEPSQIRSGKGEKYFKAIDADGNVVAEALVKIHGETAEIKDILVPGKPRETARNEVGAGDIRAILKQFQQQHPEVKTITGDRVSGARAGGGYDNTKEAPKASVNLKSDQPLSLLQFLADKGGLKPHGDLTGMDAHRHRVQIPGKKGFFGLVKSTGMPLDMAREAAEEAGYLRGEANKTSTERDLLDAIDTEMRGQRTYADGEEGTKTKRDVAREDDARAAERDNEIAAARRDIDAEYPDMPEGLLDAAATIMFDENLDIDSAVEQAAMRIVNEDADYEISHDDIADTFGEGAFDAIQPQPAYEDGGELEPASAEKQRSGEGEEASRDGERVPDTGAEASQGAGEEARSVDNFIAHVEAEISGGHMNVEIAPTTSMKDFRAAAEARGWTQGAYGKGTALWSPDRTHAMFYNAPVEGNHLNVQWVTPGDEITPPLDEMTNIDARDENGKPIAVGDRVTANAIGGHDIEGTITRFVKNFPDGDSAAEIQGDPTPGIGKSKKPRPGGLSIHRLDQIAKISEPATEHTESGEQTVLPGAEKIGDGELAQRKADTGLKPKATQRPADDGLFGDSMDQRDLLDQIEATLGTDANLVAPVDIARAAEIMEENPGMEPATAFGHAVIETAVEQGFITEQEAIKAYGKEAAEVIDATVEIVRKDDGSQSDVRAYNIMVAGEKEGSAQFSFDGDTATLQNIGSMGIGPSMMRKALREFIKDNPQVKTIRAYRETGARADSSIDPNIEFTVNEKGNLVLNRKGVLDGEEVKNILEAGSEGASGSSGDVEQERAEPDEIGAGDAAEAGVVPSGGENRQAEVASDGRGDDAAAAPDTTEQPAADGNEGANGAAAEDTDNARRVAERDAPKWAEITHALPLDSAGHKDMELAARLMFEISGIRQPSFNDLTPAQKGELLARLKPEDKADGIPNAVPDGDARAGAEDVQPTEPGGEPAVVRGREGAGGGADVRGADEGRTEGDRRVSEGALGEGSAGRGDGGADRVSGARVDDAPEGRAERNAERAADRVEGENHVIEPGGLQEGRSWRQKALNNITAIELMRDIEVADRPATAMEQRMLAQYVGWGGIKNAFPGKAGEIAKGFEDIAAKVKSLLSPEEYETARRSIQYAHYTSEDIVRSMWSAVQRLGFTDGQVFEPGMGVGNFAGMMPGDVAANSHYAGIELDHISARIAKLLYPKYGVRRDDFTKAPLPENNYDLIIGNPPFADVSIKSDPKYKQGFLLHDYFFAKSLDAVRPGGLLAFVTSAGTMNKGDAAAREYLADRADLLGAIRLPGNAFAKNAGTEVTTDIIFLRKRLPGDVAGNRSWTEVVDATLPGPEGKPIDGFMSRYFAEHPEMVLGEQGFFDKLYQNRYAVRAPKDFDLKAELAKAIDNLPRDVMTARQGPAEHAQEDFGTVEKKEGTFYVGPNGDLHQVQSGVGRPVASRGKGVEGGRSAGDIERIRALVPVRDALRAVYAADLAGNTGNADRARDALNRNYDAFVAKFGPINKSVIQTRRPTIIQQESARAEAREAARYADQQFREGTFDPRRMLEDKASLAAIARARQEMRDGYAARGLTFDEGEFDVEEIPDTIIDKRPNVDPFMDDPESYRLRAIERYNEATGTGQKSPVFTENVVSRERAPEINSVNDALLYSLNQFGRVNVPAMAGLSKKSESEVIEELGEQVFRQPGTADAYQTRDEYLSGDVRKKLEIAKAAAEKNPDYRRNVTALEASQPMPLAPSQIHATLGMPWIPPSAIRSFATDELGLDSLNVQYIPALAQWVVSGDADSVAASTTWGTADRRAPALINDALNHQNPKIYDIGFVDGRKVQTLNVVKTEAAQEKMRAIQQKFQDWIWTDQERADSLAEFYNEKFNNLVVREYNGDYLTTPGIASNWKWRPHQTRGIARIIQSGNTYLAHAVGAGKTSEMIGAVMEMRRLGLVRKPMIAVPNHMLAQFTKEFYEQYPTARLMVADERRFHTDRRKQFIANVASEDLDAVIITHSAFGMIPVSDDFQTSIITNEINQYRALMAQVQGDRITRSRVEKQIERLEQRLTGKGNKRRDAVFTFEEMGIDHLSVDEAHLFRKLDFSTQMSGLKGISPDGSEMAWDLYVKAQYLESIRPGRGLVLASGTPVTNTMAELYTVSRYLQPQVLAERGLEKFDAWAGAFGENVSELEQDAAGNYKPVSRFAKFVNVAELSNMVRQVMDVVTSRQLEQYVTRPQLRTGQRIMNLADKSPQLERFQRELAERMKVIQARKGPPKKGDDIMLSVINDGRHAAIDMRLAGGTASSTPSKLDLLIDNVHDIYQRSSRQQFHKPSQGGGYEKKPAKVGPAAQMIFANLGLSGKRGFSVPDYIRAELVRRGIPKSEIAYIYDYKTSVAKQRLFNDMNEGKIRVLIGSTAKMATGVNAQRQLIANHNLDPLWYPADDEQRNGRIIRQGNMNPEIEIHDYSTKGTYDSTMWGMMAKKAKFIQGFFEGDPSLRDMDDLGEASQYEQAKALTTNDPRLIKMTELKQELERAQRRKVSFDSEAYATRQRRASARSESEHYTTRIAETEKDIAQRTETRGELFAAKIGKTPFDKRTDFGEALFERIAQIEEKGTLNGGVKIADIGGFPLYVQTRKGLKGENIADIYLVLNGGKEREVHYGASPLGTVRSIEAILGGFENDLATYQSRQDKADRFYRESEDKAKARFGGDAEIATLTAQVREMEVELSKPIETVAPPSSEGQEDGSMASAMERGELTPAAESQVQGIEKALRDFIKRVAGDFAVEIHQDPIPVSNVSGYGDAVVTHAGAMYVPSKALIRIALAGSTEDVVRRAIHEPWHAIEDRLLTDQERRLMERETARMREAVKQRNPRSYTAEQLDKFAGFEIRAMAFEQYGFERATKPAAEAGVGMHMGIRRFFERVWQALQRLSNYLRGLGFKRYEDIFDDALRGEFAQRPASEFNQINMDSMASSADEGPSMASSMGGGRGGPPNVHETLTEALEDRNLPRLASVARAMGGNRVNLAELRTRLQDRFIRVRNAERSANPNLPTSQSAYQAESLYYGRTGEQLEVLEREHFDPLIKDMQARDISLEDLNEYLYAKHAPERNRAMDAINHPELMPGGRDLRGRGSGMSNEEAQAVMDGINADGKMADFEAVEARVRKIVDDTREGMIDSGLISQDTADAWAKQYEFYVPLQGFAEGTEDEAYSGRGQGFDTRARETQQAFGRLSRADGPLPYIMMQAEKAIVRGEKNKVGNAWLRFVRQNPDVSRWTIDQPPLKKTIDKSTGLVTTVQDPNWQNDPNIFVTKIGGRPHLIQMPGNDGANLVRALKNLGSENLNDFLKATRFVTVTMSRLATQFNPDFIVPNLVRDLGEAYINMNEQNQKGFIAAFTKHLPRTFGGAFRGLRGSNATDAYTQAFYEFDKAGGRIRFFGLDSAVDIEKGVARKLRQLEGGAVNTAMEAGKKLADGFEVVNGAMENATRLAAYMAAREVGMTAPDAAMLARNLTVDFNKRGELGAVMNSLYMFSNVAFQGSRRTIHALNHKNVRRAAYGLIAIGALSAMLGMMSGGDDDTGENYYKRIKDWERDKNLIIMWPKGMGHDGGYIKIPLPFGFNMFKVLGDRLAGVAMGKDKPADAFTAILKSIGDAFNPLGEESVGLFSLFPSALRPPLHVATNKNWNGNTIYPENQWEKHKPDSEQSKRNTSPIAKEAARTLNSATGGSPYKGGAVDWHPDSIQHIFESITGGLGKFFVNSFDTANRAMRGEDFDVTKAPIIRRFAGSVTGPQGDASAFYSAREEARKNGGEAIKQARKDRASGTNREAAESFLQGNTNSARGEQIFKTADEQMKPLRDRQKRIENSADLTSDEKRAQLAEVTERMRTVQNRARKQYREMKEGATP